MFSIRRLLRMPGIFKNQAVAYKADPSLYGPMHVLELKDGYAHVELDAEGTTEVFREGELVAAMNVWTGSSGLAAVGSVGVIPDAPPDNM